MYDLTLIEWLTERKDNCARIAAGKTGADRDGWLEDQEYFDLAIRTAGDLARYRLWVADLQSGMYVNCVYCGHRYGLYPGSPVAMAEVLKQHVEQCPEHPMSKLQEVRDDLLEALKGVYALIESGQLRRNTSDDPNPDFAARQIPFVTALAKADRAIAKAEGKS